MFKDILLFLKIIHLVCFSFVPLPVLHQRLIVLFPNEYLVSVLPSSCATFFLLVPSVLHFLNISNAIIVPLTFAITVWVWVTEMNLLCLLESANMPLPLFIPPAFLARCDTGGQTHQDKVQKDVVRSCSSPTIRLKGFSRAMMT